MQDSQTIEATITLIQPVFKAVEVARNKAVVFVIGATGDGKSTLINYLSGCTYEPNLEAKLSDSKIKRKLGSLNEVCTVGKKIKSETLYPQPVQVTYGQQTIVYSDLPGFFDTRGEAERICAAFTHHLLSNSVSSNKGIVWVIKKSQFENSYARDIREVVKYYLKISGNNPELISNSLTIVITHTNGDALNKKEIVYGFDRILEGIDEQNEKRMLQEIINNIKTNPEKLVISNIFEEKTREDIHSVIIKQPEQSPKLFDFSCYSAAQFQFMQYLESVANYYLDNSNALVINKGSADKNQLEIEETSKIQQEIKFYQDKANTEKKELEGNLVKLELQKDGYQKKIGEVEGKNIQEIIFFKKDAIIEPEKRTRPYPNPQEWADNNSSVCQGYALNTYNIEIQKGNRAEIEVDGNNIRVISYIPAKPVSGTSKEKLCFSADYPVSVRQKTFAKGENVVSNTEKTDKGYEVEIEYQLGQGADTTIVLEIAYKDTPEGKRILLELQQLKTIKEEEILLCKQKLEKLTQEINHNSYKEGQLQIQLAELEKKKVGYVNELNKIQEILISKKEFYNSVYKICEILNLSQTNNTMQDFMNCFESANTIILKSVKSEAPSSIQASPQASELKWSSAPHSTLYGNYPLRLSYTAPLEANNIQTQNSSENVIVTSQSI